MCLLNIHFILLLLARFIYRTNITHLLTSQNAVRLIEHPNCSAFIYTAAVFHSIVCARLCFTALWCCYVTHTLFILLTHIFFSFVRSLPPPVHGIWYWPCAVALKMLPLNIRPFSCLLSFAERIYIEQRSPHCHSIFRKKSAKYSYLFCRMPHHCQNIIKALGCTLTNVVNRTKIRNQNSFASSCLATVNFIYKHTQKLRWPVVCHHGFHAESTTFWLIVFNFYFPCWLF